MGKQNNNSIEIDIIIDVVKFKKDLGNIAKEASNKIKQIKKNNDITPIINQKKLHKTTKEIRHDILKEAKQINKGYVFTPTVNDKKINDELANVRQDLSAFYRRIESKDASSYAKRVTEMERYKKKLTQLKNLAEKTGNIDVANELGTQLEKFKLKTTQAKAELRNFVKVGQNNVSVLGKLFNEVTTEIGKSREELIKLGKSTKDIDKLEKQIEQVNKDFKSGKINAQQYAQSLQKINNNSKKATKETKFLGGAMTKLIGIAAGYAVFDKAKDYVLSMDRAVTKLQVSTGSTKKELDSFLKSARNLQGEGFGDFDQNLDILAKIQRSLKITGKEAEDVAKNVLLISNNFEESESEVFKATNSLAKNMKLSFGEAGDYILKALQKTNDPDLIDNIAEYSVNFKKMGYSAQDMFNIMIKGAENGAYKLDKVNDAIKEAEVSLTDNSKSTRDAFTAMGLNYDEYLGKIKSGELEVKDVLEVVNKKLLTLDAGLQDEVGTAIYRTKWEELSDEVLIGLTDVEDKLGDVTGTTEKAAKVVEESLGGSWAKVKSKTGPFFDHMSKSFADLLLKIIEVGNDLFIKLPTFLGKSINAGINTIISYGGKFIKGGKDLVISLGGGIVSATPQIIASIKDIGNSIMNYLKELPGQALQWGANLGSSFAKGIKGAIGNVGKSAIGLATKAKRIIGVESPTKEGPLAIDQSIWGKNLGETWAKGLASTVPAVRKAVDKLAKEAQQLSELQLKFKTKDSVQTKYSKLTNKLGKLDYGSKAFEDTETQIRLLGELQKKYNGEKLTQSIQLEKTIKDLNEEHKKGHDEQNKSYKEGKKLAQDYYDTYKKKTDESKKSLDKLLETQKKLNEELADTTSDKDTKIAERSLEIEERLLEIKKEFKNADSQEKKKLREEKKKLIEEQGLNNNNLNQETLDEVKRVQGLSDTEKILESFEKDKEALENKLALVQDNIDEETKIYNQALKLKEDAEKLYTDFIKVETDTRISEQERMLENARKISDEMNKLGFNGKGFKATYSKTVSDGNGGSKTISETKIINYNTINNDVDVNKLGIKMGREVLRQKKV